MHHSIFFTSNNTHLPNELKKKDDNNIKVQSATTNWRLEAAHVPRFGDFHCHCEFCNSLDGQVGFGKTLNSWSCFKYHQFIGDMGPACWSVCLCLCDLTRVECVLYMCPYTGLCWEHIVIIITIRSNKFAGVASLLFSLQTPGHFQLQDRLHADETLASSW